jgi:Lysine-specific metallo-endopeptidase
MAHERSDTEPATARVDVVRDMRPQMPSPRPGVRLGAGAALWLQRTAGNAAVARLVAAQNGAAASRLQSTGAAALAVDRDAPVSGRRSGTLANESVSSNQVRRPFAQAAATGQGPQRPIKRPPLRGTARPLQRNRAAAQRGVSSKRTPDCPGYGPGEIARSRTEAGILVDDVKRVPGHLLISDFGVDQSKLKGIVRRDPLLLQMIVDFERDQDRVLTILGLDDCVGAVGARQRLREARAEEIFKLLGPSARTRVRFVGAADANLFHSDNRSSGGRALNRGVLIGLNQNLDFQAEKIEGKVSPPLRGTVDCTPKQKAALEKAHSMAVSMATRAYELVHGQPSTTVARLLRKYFRDDSDPTVDRVRAGFKRVVSGLTATTLGAKYECEEAGQWQIPLLPSCNDPSTLAYSIPWIGFRIHVCEAAFTTRGGILDLASTLVHEHSHLYDGTQFLKTDEPYCEGGCPPSLSPSEAINTADAYSEFAKEAHILGL